VTALAYVPSDGMAGTTWRASIARAGGAAGNVREGGAGRCVVHAVKVVKGRGLGRARESRRGARPWAGPCWHRARAPEGERRGFKQKAVHRRRSASVRRKKKMEALTVERRKGNVVRGSFLLLQLTSGSRIRRRASLSREVELGSLGG
jgi:hypothetical protein